MGKLAAFWGQTLQGLTPMGVALLMSMGLALFPTVALSGEDVEQLLDKSNQLLAQGNEKEALALMERAYKECGPENALPAVDLGDFYGDRQNYTESIHYREEALRRMEKFNPLPRAMEVMHANLAHDYNELGQQKYFSSELCLRLLYHLEHSWAFMLREIYNSTDETRLVEFARLKVGHYDAAVIGSHVRVQEWTSAAATTKSIRSTLNNEPSELILPPNGIEEAAKLKVKEAIVARIQAFDEAHRTYQLAPSDLPLETVLDRLEAAFRQIKSIYFARNGVNEFTGAEFTESGWYQSPDSLKLHTDIGPKGEYWFLFQGGRVYRFDPEVHAILSEDPDPFGPDVMGSLRKLNPSFCRKFYELEVQKVTVLPVFLEALYQGQPPPNLYLLTARPKTPDEMGPVVKTEYVIDLDRGLQVARQNYWHGVIGTGRKEQLVTTDVITEWAAYPGEIYLPAEGWTEQMVDVFTIENGPEQKLVRCMWRMEVVSVNEPFTLKEFVLTGYTKKPLRVRPSRV